MRVPESAAGSLQVQVTSYSTSMQACIGYVGLVNELNNFLVSDLLSSSN